jgi:photosystem II stability/assembly factor-like uncharacterized protein
LKHSSRVYVIALSLLVCFSSAAAQQYDPALFSGMQWRLIGPFRGGRSLTAVGVPGQPNTFYFGAVGGGIWKTADAGRTWKPIFDGEPIASIGAIAIAPSDPNIIYVGSGEADMRSDISYGNGVYKSTDGGRTWNHIGLDDTRQIGCILVGPQNPEVVYVAALGHAYGPNAERGVFRSTDGGKTWQKVLHKDENTGAIDLAFDPNNARAIFAVLWQTRRPPWNVYPPSNGPGSGLYKSTDGGSTWERLAGHGLPSEGLGRMGIAFSPSHPSRVYLIVDAKQGGLYRSDDSGDNWTLVNNEARLWGRGWYFGGVTVDPRDPDTVYVCNTAAYVSRDGGKSFTPFKGAPGGDDYHSLWIDPGDSRRMILSSDQGTVVSLNGGETWSSWYNQPTAQLYHIITDNRFPYWIYGAQQDTGAVAVASRTVYRGINFRGWRPISAGGESEYIAPDPLDPDTLFGGSSGLDVTKFNLITGQNQDVAPTLTHRGDFRHTWTLPLVFSPLDPHQVYFGTQQLFVTRNGGESWETASPDLTREDPGVPANLDALTATDATSTSTRRGVIYTIAPSPVAAGLVWIGTDDGLIQVTRDAGKNWTNVTPEAITPWSKVSLVEASHFDAATAYAAVDRHRLDDLRPYIYRTHDGGKSWQEISSGIPTGSYVHVVREDPKRKGLLYAGTETGVFVSFDDGDHWQPLQLNLPNASVRDLIVDGDDLVAGTHGRSIWILDDLTPLRQLDAQVAASHAWLFAPETAYRMRFGSSDQGTPLPPDEPAGKNPPNGAILDYYLKSEPSGPVVMEIEDAQGHLVRRYSSADQPRATNPQTLRYPAFWIPPAPHLSIEPGMHRFVWDLLYPVPKAPPGFDSWVRSGMWAVPGRYTVKVMVDGKTYAQPLTLKMDPRVKVSQADLEQQFKLDQKIVAARREVSDALEEAGSLQRQLAALQPSEVKHPQAAPAAKELERKLAALLGPALTYNSEYTGVPSPSEDYSSLRYVARALANLEHVVESADAAPTPDTLTAFEQDSQLMESLLQDWAALREKDLPRLNYLLRQEHLREIDLKSH